MKTVLVALYDPIESDGRVKRACEALATKFDLTLLCSTGNGNYSNPSYRITRFHSPAGCVQAIKLLRFWWHLIRTARRLKPSLVYGHDFYLPFPSWVAARLVSARVVYDAHELIVPSDGAPMDWRNRLYYFFEKLVVKRVDLVIAANPERAEAMQRHYGLQKRPTSIGNIPRRMTGTCSSAEILERYPGLRKQHVNDVHVIYMGDINFNRGIEVLIGAAAYLPDRFKLVFIGRGPDLARLQAQAVSPAVGDRIRVVGGVPHAYVQDLMREGDIGFVSYSMTGLNNVLCAPNKVFEYAHAGLPIVATCQPTVRRLVERFQIGRLVGCRETVTPQGVAQAISEIAATIHQFRASLAAFLEAHKWENESERLVSAVTELVE